MECSVELSAAAQEVTVSVETELENSFVPVRVEQEDVIESMEHKNCIELSVVAQEIIESAESEPVQKDEIAPVEEELESEDFPTAPFIERTSKGKIRDDIYFGKVEWEKYFGDVGAEPPLPHNIVEIMNSFCPFAKDQKIKVKDTHMLLLIPATINGEKLTLNRFNELVRAPKVGYPSKYKNYCSIVQSCYGSKILENSYWLLITKDVIPGSREKTFSKQQSSVKRHKGYEIPAPLEAVLCMLLEFMSSGESIYSKNPFATFTRCNEKISDKLIIVGNTTNLGIDISLSHDFSQGMQFFGVGACRKI